MKDDWKAFDRARAQSWRRLRRRMAARIRQMLDAAPLTPPAPRSVQPVAQNIVWIDAHGRLWFCDRGGPPSLTAPAAPPEPSPPAVS